jgi:hypothetical protein
MLWESDETNNHAGASILTTVTDAYVVSVEPPDDLVGGVGPRPYRVRVGRSNVGPDFVDVPVRLCVVGNFCAPDVWLSVPRGGEVTTTINLGTPNSFGGCGQVNYFTVTACTNLLVDANRTNDCHSITVPVAAPYWDYEYVIASAPPEGRIGDTIRYTVRVTNRGNIRPLNSVCSRTAICLNRHGFEPAWNDCIRGCGPIVPLLFNVQPINPGSSRSYSFDYPICQGAYRRTQYINAGPDYSAGCGDACHGPDFDPSDPTTSNNHAYEPIPIR